MNSALDWLQKNHEGIISGLAELVAVQSISTDGEHHTEIERTAQMTCDQMREAGLTNVETLKVGNSLPYAYGEWLEAGPNKPTVFLYAHHDVQPVNYIEQWLSDPWKLTRRDNRLFARGSADDKGAITAFLAAIAAYRKTGNQIPVNIKMVVEGEEEVGSKNLMKFFDVHKKKLQSDVIVVCDTENIEVGLPCITYSLRGIVALLVEVTTARTPVHSGMAGGAVPDAALALNSVLARLFAPNAPLPVPGLYDSVRTLTEKEKTAFKKLPWDDAKFRKELGVLPGCKFAMEDGLGVYEQTWRRPSATIIAQEASSIKGASNQVLPKASAIVSCRIVPDQKPDDVVKQMQAFLSANPPYGCDVKVTQHGAGCDWWMTDPNGPAFEAALAALRVAELFGGAPALLVGIEDPASNAHAPNESLHEGDFKKLMASLVRLFNNLGKLNKNEVK
jgi:cysteinylglycine-S-conjugate dipeptidase